MDAPAGGWVERDGNELTMGCHSGKHTWTLTCVHGRWQGATGQCGTGKNAYASSMIINACDGSRNVCAGGAGNERVEPNSRADINSRAHN